jgi:hypothetical protein
MLQPPADVFDAVEALQAPASMDIPMTRSQIAPDITSLLNSQAQRSTPWAQRQANTLSALRPGGVTAPRLNTKAPQNFADGLLGGIDNLMQVRQYRNDQASQQVQQQAALDLMAQQQQEIEFKRQQQQQRALDLETMGQNLAGPDASPEDRQRLGMANVLTDGKLATDVFASQLKARQDTENSLADFEGKIRFASQRGLLPLNPDGTARALTPQQQNEYVQLFGHEPKDFVTQLERAAQLRQTVAGAAGAEANAGIAQGNLAFQSQEQGMKLEQHQVDMISKQLQNQISSIQANFEQAKQEEAGRSAVLDNDQKQAQADARRKMAEAYQDISERLKKPGVTQTDLLDAQMKLYQLQAVEGGSPADIANTLRALQGTKKEKPVNPEGFVQPAPPAKPAPQKQKPLPKQGVTYVPGQGFVPQGSKK